MRDNAREILGLLKSESVRACRERKLEPDRKGFFFRMEGTVMYAEVMVAGVDHPPVMPLPFIDNAIDEVAL